MSVIINGMEMPTSCSECAMNYDYFKCIVTGTKFFDHEHRFNEETTRLDNCPLVPAADVVEKEECDACGSKTRSVIEILQKKIPRWIPVEERLPDGKIEVLVSAGIFAPLIEVAFWDGLFYSAWDGKTEIVAVTHWMPLPQSPKEDDT